MGHRIRNMERGFSLIELSVAAAIYSMGLGSLSLLMMLAVQGTTEARHETAAALQSESLAEMIAMSSDAFGHSVFPVGGEPCGPVDGCPGGTQATLSALAWQARVASDLPAGAGTVCRDSTPEDGTAADTACDGAGGPVVKVFWSTPAESGQPPDTHRQVTRLPLP